MIKLSDLTNKKLSDEIGKVLERTIINDVERAAAARDAWLRNFMWERYRVLSDEDMKKCIERKRLTICTNAHGEFVGIIANNRWLYTIDGKTIGKKGRRFLFEQL